MNKIKRTILVEILYHSECYSTLINITKSFCDSVLLFTTNKVWNQLDEETKKCVKKDEVFFVDKTIENKTPKNFFDKLRYQQKISMELKDMLSDVVNRGDIVIINTVQEFIVNNLLKIIKKIKNAGIFVGVHNIHEAFPEILSSEERLTIKKSTKIKRKKRSKKYILSIPIRGFYKRKERKIMKQVDGVYVFGESTICLPNIRCTRLPIRLAKKKYLDLRIDKKNALLSCEKVRFVIPGSVSMERRDYKEVIGAAKKLVKDGYKNFQIIFLGKSSYEVEKIIDENKMRDFFLTFHEFVDEEKFKSYLLTSHYVLSPIFGELPYGKYKATGNLGDAQAYAVPIILPKSYAPYFKFGRNVIKYEKGSLSECLKLCLRSVKNEKYEILFEASIRKAREILPEKVAEDFKSFLMRQDKIS